MQTQDAGLLSFVQKYAAKQGITMTELAGLCGFSRTTLYRYLKKDSQLKEKEEAALGNALCLSEQERGVLHALASGDALAMFRSDAYAYMNRVLLHHSEQPSVIPTTFAYYCEGEKYLRSAEEVCDAIETACGAEGAVISMRVVNCIDETPYAFLQLLVTKLFLASPFITMEHLISFIDGDDARTATILSRLMFLLRYNGYHAFYTSLVSETPSQLINAAYITVTTKTADDKQNSVYFSVNLFANDLSQCICYTDAAMNAYLTAQYMHHKSFFQDTLLFFRNMQVFHQELSDFEISGGVCLFKSDICYNDVPPEVYKSLFSRMSAAEKRELAFSLTGCKPTNAEMGELMRQLLATLEQRYAAMRSKPYRLICCRNGLLNFAKTGLITGNVVNLPPFSPTERGVILKAMYEYMNEGVSPVLIVPNPILPDGTIISVNPEKGILIDFGGLRTMGFSQNVFLTCATVTKLLAGYAYSRELAELAYPREAAQQFVDEMIKRMNRRSPT